MRAYPPPGAARNTAVSWSRLPGSFPIANRDYPRSRANDRERMPEDPPTDSIGTPVALCRGAWGSVNAGVDAVMYLSDLSRRKLTYSLGANNRIVKG